MISRIHRLKPIRVALALALSVVSLSSASATPIADVFASRAGRLIFSELYEGILTTNRILPAPAANPELRMQRLIEVFSRPEMAESAEMLQRRMDIIEAEFARAHPNRARAVFGGEARLVLSDAERRLIRDLVMREFTPQFMDEITTLSYQSLRRDFIRGAESAERLDHGNTALTRGLSPQERAFVFWETQKNAAASRSLERIAIEHYEIPLELLVRDVSRRASSDLLDAMTLERDGRKFVRWIINPEDTIHYKEVEKFLRSKGIEPVRHKSFEAYQTASRSYVIVSTEGGRRTVFSAKVSTNRTGGAWRDKKQPVQDAVEARRAADLVVEQSRKLGFRNVVVMDEPVMFGIQDIDQAMLIRVLGDMPSGEVTYLPGFSAMHTDLGARIARANGATDVAAFWDEHYNKPLARAIAELAAKTGLTYDSPHSQNFLIEMIGVNPTGRIVMRDFGDTYALADFFQASGRRDFLQNWAQDNITHGQLTVSVGILHGNTMPTWMTESIYSSWGRDFYNVFEREFAAITGIPREQVTAQISQNGRYFNKRYSTGTSGWEQYLRGLSPSTGAVRQVAPGAAGGPEIIYRPERF